MNEPVLATLQVIDALEKLDIPYLIGGSFASTTYGHVRTTQDVQSILLLQSEQLDFHYMQETAKTMQLSDLLERLLSQTNC